jgi:hypothetical protein
MEDIIRNMPLIDLYSKSIGEKMKGGDPYDIINGQNPGLALKTFNASLEAFLATLGDPNMGAASASLKDLGKGLDNLSHFFKEHPTAGRILFDVAAGLAAVGTVAGALLLAVAPVMALARLAKWAGIGAGAAGAAGAAGGVGAAGAGILGQLGIIGTELVLYDGIKELMKTGIDKGFDLLLPNNAEERKKVGEWQKNYSPFDRSTWADPNNFWANDGPNVPGYAQRHPSGATPVFIVNPDHVGQAIGNGIGNGLAAPATGPTSFDIRIDAPQPGLNVLP